MSDIPSVKLNNGLAMPQFGLGVWRIPEDEAADNVQAAIAAGYRLIDTAAIYRNEAGVGEAVRQSGVPRAELFVTSKLWNSDQGYDSTIKAFEASLERLGLDYLDLYLIHWPQPMYDTYVESWKAMERLYKEGRVKAIGVSNFQPAHVERLAAECEVVPAVNQVELHPLLTQAEVRAYDAAHGIVTESWSPLRGVIGEGMPDVLRDMAAKYGKTPAQVVLRWHIQLGLVVIPRSSKPERIRENRDIFDFELDAADVQAISALNRDERLGAHPDTMDKR
ncbi:MAG TPA: aldo/keto reductase [Candidatus Saccharimonadia bacterium]|nr:aldo/keto reductase [Candidatus Saccharimonadia bacterium]